MKHTKLMKGLKTIAILLASIITVLLIGISLLVIFGKGQLLLPIPKKEAFELANNHKYAYELRVEGTKIYNELGEQVILSGLMVPEAKILDGNGEFNKQYFEEVFKCGGYAIRIPVHPDEWVEDEYYLWRYLDPIVSWAIEYNKYVILDLHFIGNIQTGEGSEMKDVGKNTYDFSIEFWNMIANTT